jgi:hypothetical protein
MLLRFRRRILQDPYAEDDYRTELDDITRDPRDPAYLQTAYEVRAYMTDEQKIAVAEVKAAHTTAAPQSTPRRRPPEPRATGTAPRLNLPTLIQPSSPLLPTLPSTTGAAS